jgi:hypothetical protein
MTKEKAFQLYMATRLHFLTKYDVFASKGNFAWKEKVSGRNDIGLILPFLKITKTERELIELCVSNFLYGNDNFLYDSSYAEDNYIHWLKVKQSISYCLERDLGYIEFQLMKNSIDLDTYLRDRVISDLLSRKVEYESIVLMDRYHPLIDSIAGFDSDKYKARMKKADKFILLGSLNEQMKNTLENFFESIV